MKKIILLSGLFFLCFFSIFAYTDSMSYMYGNEAFAALMDAINLQEPYDKLKASFQAAVKDAGNDIATQLKLQLSYYDYLNSVDYKKYKKEIKAGLNDCYDDFAKLEKSNTIPVIQKSLEFLLYAIDYRITGSLNKGLKSLNLLDSLYEEYSDDLSVLLLYAQRKSQAPKIGGGDKNMAISILTKIQGEIENKSKAFKFIVFSELASLYNNSNPSQASYYSEKAKALY